jgi:steroid delta-isomerase-like uncharacterized protein
MLDQDLDRTVHEIYGAYRTRDFEDAAESFADDAVVTIVPTGEVYEGREGYVRYVRAWAAAFPDLKIEIARLETSGSTGVVEYSLRGTHTGPLVCGEGFVPATCATIDLRLCDVLGFEDGRITRLESYFDSATLLRQMGLLPHSPLHAADRRAGLELYATTVDTAEDQRNKALVHRFLEEVVNQRNPAAAAAICASDVAWHGAAIGEAHDLGGVQSQLAALLAAFPDLELEVHDTIAEQTRVAARMTLRGTHLGEFQGVPATGRRVASRVLGVFRIADGHVAEQWWQSELSDVLRRLDAIPAART